jgi:hypothetical protein
MLPRLASMLAVWVVLLVWQLSAPHLGAAGVTLFVLLLALPVTMSGAEWVFCRRQAFRREYLNGPSWLDRLLGLGPPVVLVETVKAVLLTLLLMTAVLSLDLRGWAVWLLDVLILAMLMPRLPGLLADVVRRTYLFTLARRWAIWFSTLLLWLEGVLGLMLEDGQHYRGLSWREALEYSMPDGSLSAQGPADALWRLHAGADGLGAWSAAVLRTGADPTQADPTQQVAALMVLTVLVLVWFLVALAYSRALIGALARPLAVWRPRPRRGSQGDDFEAWWV